MLDTGWRPQYTFDEALQDYLKWLSEYFIGIQPATLTPEIARLLGINRTSGVVVMQVETPSPAAEAGIQPGDIVIAFNGQETATAEELIAALRNTKPGDRVQLTVLRGANTQQITVTVAERAST